MSELTLGEVVARTSDWTTVREEELVNAFERSTLKVTDLRRLLSAVEAWWTDSEPSTEARRVRLQWRHTVADGFLRRVGKAGIDTAAGQLLEFDERLVFLWEMVNIDVGRYLIQDALIAAISLLKQDLPPSLPDVDAAAAWTTRTVQLIDLAGVTARAEGIARVLDGLPEWQLEAVLRALGRLLHYDNYYRELAFAFGLTSNASVARVLASVGSGPRTSRQNELLSVLGRRTAEDRAPAVPAGALSPQEARNLLHRVEASAPPDGRVQLQALLDSHRYHHHEVARILSDYLARIPRNHEDVFDLLTRHGTRARGYALRSWGGPSVTFSMYGSMRLSSFRRPASQDPDAPSPDFDAGDVTRHIPVGAAVALIKDQPDPEFSLHYLNGFSHRPDFEAIADQIADDISCVARWEHGSPADAIMIWTMLDGPSLRAPSLRALRWRLFPRLLPQFRARDLPRIVSHIPDEYNALVHSTLTERVVARPTIDDLRHLFAATMWLGTDARTALLEKLEVSPLALIPSDGEAREKWLKDLSTLLDDAPDVCGKILSAINPSAAGSLALEPSLSDSTVSQGVARARLALKVRIIDIWTANDPVSCKAELERNAQADFNFVLQAGFDREPLGHVPTEPRPLCSSDEWLDAITSAAPTLIIPYAAGMLKNGPSIRESNAAVTIQALGYTLVRWFRRRQIDTPDEVWAAARERIKTAAGDNDLETAAAIGALELPGDAAKLRELRELTVREISLAMTRGRDVSNTLALSRLRAVLVRDAPDLAETLVRPCGPC